MNMGKMLKEVKPNYKFIITKIIVDILCLIGIGFMCIPKMIAEGGLPKDIPFVNIIILFVIIGVPVILLVICLVCNIRKLWYRLELYENGITLCGRPYTFSELGQLRVANTNYNFLGFIPIMYYELFTDVKKVSISDLDYHKAHKAFVLTYDDLRFGGN